MNKSQVTRRRFMLLAGGTVGATALACGGLATVGTRQPKIEFVKESYQGAMNTQNKILVAYASQCGSTGQVAQTIGQTLADAGATVDVRPVQDVSDLGGYRAVVVGSAIRRGKWLRAASTFVETHQSALSRLPTAYFTVCMALHQDTPENRSKATAYLEPVRQIVKPIEEGFFAGKMNYDTLALVDRLVITSMFKLPEGDWRDWRAIQTWAQALEARFALRGWR